MKFLKKYFKCLFQRRMTLIVLVLICIGISSVSIYSFINPSKEDYQITFKYDSNVDLSSLKSYEYNLKIKEEIETIRKQGEYVILNDFKYEIAPNSTVEAYKDSKGYDCFKIINGDKEIKEYGIYDGRKFDTYILINDYYVYTKGVEFTYENNKLTLNDKVYEGVWDNEYHYSYSSFSYVKVSKLTSSVKYTTNSDGSITLSIDQRFFNTWQQARRFMMRMAQNLSSDKANYKIGDNYVTSDSSKTIDNSVISATKGVSMLKWGLISASIGIVIDLIFVLVLVIIKKEEAIDTLEYDNEEIFKYPFKKNYWKKSVTELKSQKNIIMMTMLFAMMQVVRLIPVPSGFGMLGISLSSFFFAIIGMLYGPTVGLFIGFISDIFGYFVFPNGYPFHIGYSLQAALIGFTYGICFYKTKVSFTKCLFARLMVNLVFNALLGSILWGDVSGFNFAQTKAYMLTLSLPKNIAYLLPQSFALYLVFKALAPAFKALGVVNPLICDDINKTEMKMILDNKEE